MADLKVALIEARDEAAKKEKQIRELKSALRLREECVRYGITCMQRRLWRRTLGVALLPAVRTD